MKYHQIFFYEAVLKHFTPSLKPFLLGLSLLLIGAAVGSGLVSTNSEESLLGSPAFAHTDNLPTNTFVNIAKEQTPAVVNISTKQKVKPRSHPGAEDERLREFYERYFPKHREMPKEQVRQSLGSGFVVEADGYILTNNHVVEKADEIVVTFGDGSDQINTKEFSAKIVASDPKTDIALIKIEGDRPFPTLKLGNSEKLQVGEWVMAIGNPFGFSQSVTVGVVSAKGRVIGAGPYDAFIQTDASINPGNSGGPLLNVKGEVVGISTAIFTGGASQGNIGIGFATPINSVKQIYDDLKEGAVKRGWLGVMIQPITPEIQKALELADKFGALVGDVFDGSPAKEVGMLPGDIIIEFDGEEVQSSDQLPSIVAKRRPGTEVEVNIIRNGDKMTISLKLGNMPKDGDEEKSAESKEENVSDLLGMTVAQNSVEIARRFSIKKDDGVIVVNVVPESPAWTAGVRPGDIIVGANRVTVNDLNVYNDILGKTKPGESLLLFIKRENHTVFLAIKIPEKE